MADDARSEGFTLTEVLIAMSLIVLVAMGVCDLCAISTRVIAASRQHASSAIFAGEKIEELRSTGVLALMGAGGSLTESQPGFAEWLDSDGRSIGFADPPPAAATYIRRWSVGPVHDGPAGTVLVQVRVDAVASEARRGASGDPRSRSLGETAFAAVVTPR
jgi:prepilin-type N-terminal cleavage/methylation domain-containing protein